MTNLHFLKPKAVLLSALSLLLLVALVTSSSVESASASQADSVCRFGITAPRDADGYDLATIGIGSLLDWGAVSNPSLPAGVEYIRVLRVNDAEYPGVLANLPGWILANPGGIWVIGNEPDTTYEGQDGVLAEVYADRFYALASLIRSHDPTARIGFGTVVQPTPIRIRYLERAWQRLVEDAGSASAVSALIDFWSIHSFILNEAPDQWGTGVPPGFENDHDDAVIITDFTDTYSIDIFSQRIIAFRQWMAGLGERAKPLWITEYGSLFPPIDPPGGPDLVNVSDADTSAYMQATFDFMLSASDAQTGLPPDGNHLVQRWFWYSLNEHRFNFGGSVYNPDYPAFGARITLVGQDFIGYQSLDLAQPDLLPLNLHVVPVSYDRLHNRVNYQIYLQIGSTIQSDTKAGAHALIYDGDPQNGGTLIGEPFTSSDIQRCGGSQMVSAAWDHVVPFSVHTLFVRVVPLDVEDANWSNNDAQYTILTTLPKFVYIPQVSR